MSVKITVELVSCLTFYLLALGVEGGGGLVEEQYPGVPHQRPGDGHPLLLPARQLRALAAHPRAVSQGEAGDEAVDVGPPGRLHHLLHAHLPLVVPVLDVVRDGSVKQDWLLRHETKLGSEPGQIESLNILLLNVQISRLQIIQSLNQLE